MNPNTAREGRLLFFFASKSSPNGERKAQIAETTKTKSHPPSCTALRALLKKMRKTLSAPAIIYTGGWFSLSVHAGGVVRRSEFVTTGRRSIVDRERISKRKVESLQY